MIRLVPKLHDTYVGKAIVVTVLLVWSVLVGLDAMQTLAGELKNLGHGYTFGHALVYVLYTVPRRAYTLFPNAAVIGALMGLGQLAASSELTALRAIGLSRMRLTVSVMLTLGLLTALMMAGMETVGAWGQIQAQNVKLSSRYGDVAVARYSGMWAREGNVFLNAASGEEVKRDGKDSLLLHDVRLYQVGDDSRLDSITHAASAEHVSGGWRLQDVSKLDFGPDSVRQSTLPQQEWQSRLDPQTLAVGLANPTYMAASDLSRNIDYRRRNELDARDYEQSFWSRVFYPLNVLALCLAAIPFAFGNLRSGGAGKRLFYGVLFALGFWLLQTMCGKAASAFRVDYRIAYVLPPVLTLLTSWWIFRKRDE